jgi:hypothetical protein
VERGGHVTQRYYDKGEGTRGEGRGGHVTQRYYEKGEGTRGEGRTRNTEIL